MEMNIVIAGEAGQGAFSVELELTETLSRLNYHFFATKNYMSRVRGGHNFHMIRIADHPVHALRGGKWDMVVALDGETERRHKPNLREGGIYLSREMTKEIGAAAKEAFGNIAASNSILVGIVLAVIGVSPEKLAEAAEPGKEEYLRKGFEFAATMETDRGRSRFGDGRQASQVRRQSGPGPRRHPGRLPVHGRLSDDARHFHPGLLRHGRFGTPHPFRAGRGRDRGHQHGPGGILRRRPVHGGHLRRRLRAHAGGGLPGGHDGNARRHRRLPAARPGHGSSHADRAGRISTSSSTPVTGNSRGSSSPPAPSGR